MGEEEEGGSGVADIWCCRAVREEGGAGGRSPIPPTKGKAVSV